MKGMLGKDFYCYKIHTPLMESTTSPVCGHSPSPSPHFYKKIFILPSMIFHKFQHPYQKVSIENPIPLEFIYLF